MKKIIIAFFSVFLLASCSNSNVDEVVLDESGQVLEKKIQIMTSIVPLASIANDIGGDKVVANSIVPAGVSPHGFDLKPNDIIAIQKSDLVVYLDLDHIDGFLDKALDGKQTLVATEGLQFLEASAHEHNHDHGSTEEEHTDEHHEDEDHKDEHHDDHNEEHSDEHEDEHHADEHDEHGEEEHSTDPHVWGSPENMKKVAKMIEARLSQIAPEHATVFSQNYYTFVQKVDMLVADYEQSIEGKTQKEFVVFHDAYNYLFTDIGIDQTKKLVFRENVLSDPNSAELKELIDEVNLHGVKDIYREPQFQDSSLDKFANEYNLSIHVLDPIGSSDDAGGYLETLASNLNALKATYE